MSLKLNNKVEYCTHQAVKMVEGYYRSMCYQIVEGVEMFTEEAQSMFDRWYDKFLNETVD